MCTTETINWNIMTISDNDFIIFAQFKIRREITLRGCHVRGGFGVHVPRGAWLSKIEGAESTFNVSRAGSINIESSLPRFEPKNSTLLRLGTIIWSILILGWVRARWVIPRTQLLPRWVIPWLPLLLLLLPAISSSGISTVTIQFLSSMTAICRWR